MTETSPRINRHVSFSRKEYEMLQQRAKSAGMDITPFIRHEALHGHVTVLDFPPFEQHTDIIGEIAQDVRAATAASHPDRWLYQADLEQIADKLDELLAVEHDIQKQIRRGMK